MHACVCGCANVWVGVLASWLPVLLLRGSLVVPPAAAAAHHQRSVHSLCMRLLPASCQPPASLLLSTFSLRTPILLCVQAVYTTLREAEYRSTYPIAYWNVAPLRRAAASWRQPDRGLGCTLAGGPAALRCCMHAMLG
jgi:hypothetical protein